MMYTSSFDLSIFHIKCNLYLSFRLPFDGINTNNAQLGFISSCENLIEINQIEQQEFTQSTNI